MHVDRERIKPDFLATALEQPTRRVYTDLLYRNLYKPMKKYTLFFAALLLLGGLFVVGQVLFTDRPAQLKLEPLAGKDFGGDFTLKAGDKPVSLSDYKGKVVLIYFGYASCPDICPTSLAMLGSGLKRLEPEEVEQVQGIFISVDPERDQGEKLMGYAKHFHPNFIGITGTIEELKEVARQYGSFFEKSESTSAMGYLVDHTSKAYVMSKDGTLVKLIGHEATVPEIADAIRAAIAYKG